MNYTIYELKDSYKVENEVYELVAYAKSLDEARKEVKDNIKDRMEAENKK